jgi:hypothetical protein
MSHIVEIKTVLHDLEAIRLTCVELGLTWKSQRHYAWWGYSVGDYPLPQGFKKEDLGKCDHAIGIPGTTWEVGVVRRRKPDGTPDEGWTLLFDFFGSKGEPILKALGGESAPKFVQEYTVQKSAIEARRRGHVPQIMRSEAEVRRFNSIHGTQLKYQPGKMYVGITGRAL